MDTIVITPENEKDFNLIKELLNRLDIKARFYSNEEEILSEDQLEELDKRYSDYINENTKTYTVNEAMEIIRSKK